MRLLPALTALIITTSCGGPMTDPRVGTWALAHCSDADGNETPCLDRSDPDTSQRLQIDPDDTVRSWREGDPDSELHGKLDGDQLCLDTLFGSFCYTCQEKNRGITLCVLGACEAYRRADFEPK